VIGIKDKTGFRIVELLAGLLNKKINPNLEVIIQVQSRPLTAWWVLSSTQLLG
jgi:hypothetical protein